MMSRENLRALRLQIGNNRCKSISNHSFVPQPILNQIFTPPAIEQAVAELECQPEDRIDLARTIELKGVTTFAILVWMRCEDAIVEFRRAGCLDSRLPLDERTATRIVPDFGRDFSGEYQWQFLPHFFHRNDDRDIEPSVILPFIRQVGTKVSGGFGNVTKLEVHPLLQDFQPLPDGPVLIVRKTLHEKGSDVHRKMLFKNEKRSLVLLSRLKHSNIIPLFSAYAHGKDLGFLFPSIDMDLSQFFERSSNYGNFQWSFTFFSALYGLASALSNAHNIRLLAATEGVDFSGIGYHHDLRPANILVNKETFILADFGMGSVKPADQESQTAWKAGAGDYLAPECMDENLVHQDVGRAIDVWAFGCLLAEVATFIQLGAEGLRNFSEARLSPGPFMNWKTTYFYDAHGNVKDSVKQWLGSLASKSQLPDLYRPFVSLVLDILTPISERPTIKEISPCLAVLTVKAHFSATLQSLTGVIESSPPTAQVGAGSMKIWFERERLRAFGKVLCLYGSVWEASVLEFVEHEVMKCVGILLQLFMRLRSSPAIEFLTQVDGEPRVSDIQADYLNITVTALDIRKADFQNVLETEVQTLVQELWDILPKALLKKVEGVWVNSMLETDEIDQLGHIEQALSLEKSNAYQEAAAMAMMKKFRLEMIDNPNSSSQLMTLEISPGDVVQSRTFNGHQLGTYKSTTPVIIEWMYYDRKWEKIPSSERTVVMALKAQGFGVDHKPESLRLLNCLGFLEQTEGSRLGYGFVYQIPPREHAPDSNPEPLTTLLHLLILSAKNARTEPHLNQPLLGDKYRLAYMLTKSLMEFHSIGWLHENFHSNNVIFFDGMPEGHGVSPACSRIITKPYLVGLHKSRPGGEAWHTEGPALEASFLDYQHPDYTVTNHFRNGYDYYSLGLVLLEIGLWTPLRVWSGKPEFRTMSPHQFRDALVETYVPRLGPRMGEVYRDVVKLLMTDKLDPAPKMKDPDPKLERDAFNRFFDEVLDPLTALSAVHL